MNQEEYIDPKICPLCGQQNNCAHVSGHEKKVCWCADKALTFSDRLLAKVPEKFKDKACICKACLLKFNQE